MKWQFNKHLFHILPWYSKYEIDGEIDVDHYCGWLWWQFRWTTYK